MGRWSGWTICKWLGWERGVRVGRGWRWRGRADCWWSWEGRRLGGRVGMYLVYVLFEGIFVMAFWFVGCLIVVYSFLLVGARV